MPETQLTDNIDKINSALMPGNLLKNEMDQVENIYNIIIEFFTNYSFQLIGALIIFIMGYMLAGKIASWVLKLCLKNNLDITLSQFLSNTTRMLIVVMITVVSLGKLGISVTPFIAAIGAISLGAGLALQGLLANYAAGFNIIIIRPFIVGDTITVCGVTGIVTEVLLAYTLLKNEDDVTITIPNKHIVGEILHNSKNDSLLELKVGIAYQHDPLEVIELLKKSLQSMDVMGKDRKLQVGIDEFSDSAITLAIRLWTPTINLYDTKYKVYASIYTTLEANNINIPFPQRDVHIHQIAQ